MATRRIFYYCQDSNQPSGGEKHCYQHVDILVRHGFDAYALHNTDGFRQTWFDNTTPVAYWNHLSLNHDTDYIVVPESLGPLIAHLPGKKVIFNKNVYRGFNRLGMSKHGARVYLDRDVVAVISVSDHNKELLQFTYPDKLIAVVQASIRPDLLPYRPLSCKKRQIAYAAKASHDGRTLYQMLMGRAEQGANQLSDVDWVPIVDLSEQQVRDTLRDTLVFVFLSVHEGLARMPLEAMASGCLVCAYDCGAQSCYLPAAYRFEYGDLLGMARRIEGIIASVPDGLGQFDETTRESRAIAERYTDAAQERTVIDAWNRILSHADA